MGEGGSVPSVQEVPRKFPCCLNRFDQPSSVAGKQSQSGLEPSEAAEHLDPGWPGDVVVGC